MKTKPILSLLLICLTLIVMLVSCERLDGEKIDPENVEKKAVLGLSEAPYIMNVKMKMEYTYDDGEQGDLLNDGDMESSLSMNIDGTNFKMTAGSEDMPVEYTFADGTLYINMMGSRFKSEMSPEDAEDIAGSGASGIGEMSVEFFSNVEAKRGADGKITVSCKGLIGDSVEYMDSLIEELAGIGEDDQAVTVDRKNVEYIAVIDKDGRYESMKMVVHINSKVDKVPVLINLTFTVGFDYETAIEVNAPADANEYYDIGDMDGLFE